MLTPFPRLCVLLEIFKSLAQLEQPVNQEELAELEVVYKACTKAARMAFVDNHNAGYYINSTPPR